MEKFELSVKRFDEFSSEYAERFMDIDAYRSSIDRFCDLIKNQQPAILELACGPGNVTRYVKNKFPESIYVAIDLAPKMIEIAKNQITDVDFRLMDVRKISTFDIKFDAIMCSFCLPFLSKDDTNKLITDCAARLKKKGVIYLSTMEGDESMAGFETTNFSGENKIYFNYHKQQDLLAAFSDNGFIIDQINRQDYHEPDGRVTIDMIIIGHLPSSCNIKQQ